MRKQGTTKSVLNFQKAQANTVFNHLHFSKAEMSIKTEFLSSFRTNSIKDFFSSTSDFDFSSVIDLLSNEEHIRLWKNTYELSTSLSNTLLADESAEVEILDIITVLKKVFNLVSFYYEKTTYRPNELLLTLQNL